MTGNLYGLEDEDVVALYHAILYAIGEDSKPLKSEHSRLYQLKQKLLKVELNEY